MATIIISYKDTSISFYKKAASTIDGMKADPTRYLIEPEQTTYLFEFGLDLLILLHTAA